MIKNYFKVAWRNFYGNKFFSAINVMGLSAGMTVAILIGLWMKDEFSFDRFNKNYDRVAVVLQQSTVNGETGTSTPCPIPLASELRTSYKDEFKQVVLSWWNRDHILSSGNSKFTRIGKFMEAGAPDLLSLNMIQGTRNALTDPSSVILSASTAKVIFGSGTAMGKMIVIDGKLNVKVTGVYEDIPDASRFKNVAFIAAWNLLAASDDLIKNVTDSWGFDAAEIYVQVADHSNMEAVSNRIANVKMNKVKDDKDLAVYQPKILLQPMNRWHLYDEWKNGRNTGGNIRFVWLFGLIGLFVLFLACINFMNLATARSGKRAKEVGIRKTIGSLKKQLVTQFFTESFLVAAVAYGLSLVLSQILLPFFNQVAGKSISIPWFNPYFWLAGIGFSFFTGFLAGSYPALYLSSFEPIKVLKGNFRTGRQAAIPRKALVVLQFSVSMLLAIGTVVVFQQVQYAKNRPLGYTANGLLQLQINTPELYRHREAFRNELIGSGAAQEMALASSPATGIWSSRSGFDWPGKDPSLQTEFGSVAVSCEYGKTIGWQFKEGRDFSKQLATDSAALVINEAAARFMNLPSPLGATIKWDDENFKIIGIIKNMVTESPYEPVNKAVYSLKKEPASFLFIKLNPALGVAEALKRTERIYQRYSPSSPFDYKFVDENFAKKFSAEERIGTLTSAFSILAILISCLGLLGMAFFMAEQRTKEIGVRKIVGASVFSLWKLLTRESVSLVFFSCIISIPVSGWLMHHWLQNYDYRTPLSPWVFILAALATLLITLVTVSYQAIKAALANPVKSLRSE